MYGEVSPTLVVRFQDLLEEGLVFEMDRFLVGARKNSYRVVEGRYIIKFCRYTNLRGLSDTIMDYPLCTYALTPIDCLPSPTDLPDSFTGSFGCFICFRFTYSVYLFCVDVLFFVLFYNSFFV